MLISTIDRNSKLRASPYLFTLESD